MEKEVKCPKCGSTQLSANKKGFSGKKAVAGGILTGGIGLLAGTIGSNKIIITCLSCGNQFAPGEPDQDLKKAAPKPSILPLLVVILLIGGCWKLCTYSDPIKQQTIVDSVKLKRELDSLDKENAVWLKTKAGKIHKKHPDWSKEDCKNISENRYWIGMSIDMLIYERGNPNSINPSNYGNGVHYQWCWEDDTPSCFYGGEDGIVTAYN